jgi:predicted nucleic acid-binding protein
MNAVDTNILVYAFDDSAPEKQQAAMDLLDRLVGEGDSTVLLWQVACEFIAVLRRWQFQGRVSAPDVGAYAHEVLSYSPLVCPLPPAITRALALSSQYGLSHWDSVLIAAALEAGVDRFYTEDLQHHAQYGSLIAENPFAAI